MKKVVLLGDSIRLIGYGHRVAELLGEEYTVWQPDDNCRFASYTLRMAFEWKAQMQGADVIHWNNGLWDVCDLFGDGAFTPIDAYCDLMVRIARVLKTYGKTVIFATTTPTHPDMWGHDRTRLNSYNAAVTAALRAEGIIINDLHATIAADIDKYIVSDYLHLSEEGIEVAAKQVAECIKQYA